MPFQRRQESIFLCIKYKTFPLDSRFRGNDSGRGGVTPPLQINNYFIRIILPEELKSPAFSV